MGKIGHASEPEIQVLIKVAYLNYCAMAGMGQGDLSRIEVIGEDYKRHIRKYEMARNYQEQVNWL